MALNNKIKRLRRYRKYHRWFGLSLAFFLFISATTGILLALKKESDFIQPPTSKGVSKDLSTWKSIEELGDIAKKAFYAAHPEYEENTIDRMDIRPSKGIVKVLFESGWWEVQVDGTSGEIKSISRRHSDWIEALHDGSIVANWFKLLTMNYLGWGVLIMIITGIWLWYGPKQIRTIKKRPTQ